MMPENKEAIEKYLSDLSPFYQGGIELPYGLCTEAATKDKDAGDCRLIWKLLDLDIERDIYGKEILDLCCNAGFYSMMADEIGAKRVDGLDNDAKLIAAAKEFATWKILTNCHFWYLDIKDWDWNKRYDTVFFMQVLYWLTDPAKYLDLALKACRGLMVLIVKEEQPWTADDLERFLSVHGFKQEARYPDTLAAGKVVVKARRI